MTYAMYPSWCKDSNSTGSAFFGDLMVLLTRWHELLRPGVWQVLTIYKSHYHSFYAVMDDFGTLIPID